MKKCSNTNCKQVNPQSLDNFGKRTRDKDGLNYYCKDCLKVKSKISREKFKERDRIIKAKWYYKNQEKTKDSILKRKFNISFKEYEKMLEKQNACCAICNQPETAMWLGKVKYLAVDHNHKTGKNRGLLCQFCNVALGHFRDDKELILKAALYLERFE